MVFGYLGRQVSKTDMGRARNHLDIHMGDWSLGEIQESYGKVFFIMFENEINPSNLTIYHHNLREMPKEWSGYYE